MATLDCQLVQEILKKYPNDNGATAMLRAGLPHAAAEPPASRHMMQEEVIKLSQEAIEEMKGAAEAERTATEARLQAAQDELDKIKTVAQEAAALQERVEAQQQAKETAVVDAKKKVEEIVPRSADATAIDQRKEKSRQEQQQALDQVMSVKDGSLDMLCTGGWEDTEARDAAIEAVRGFLVDNGAEKTLVAALPAVFSVKPEQRGRFDVICAEGVERVLKDRQGTLEKELTAASTEAKEAHAEALGLWAMLDVAKDSKQAAEQELQTAKSEVQKGSSSAAAAAQAVRQQEQLIVGIQEAVATVSIQVEELEGALDAVKRLRSGESYKTEPAQADVVMTAVAAEPMETAQSCASNVVHGSPAVGLPVAMEA